MSEGTGYVLNASSRISWVNPLIAKGEVLSFSDAQVDESTPAATPPLKQFRLNAYTGGAVNLPSLPYPCVFELSSVRVPPNIPALYAHDVNTIVGHTKDTVVHPTNGIQSTAILSGANYRTKEIRETSGNGFPWQVSIGLHATAPDGYLKFFKSGETFAANGKQFTGPMYLAINGTLREISFTPLGADFNTLATLVASTTGVTMKKTFEEYCQSIGVDPTTLTPEAKAAMTLAYNAWVAAQPAEANANTPPTNPPANPVNATTQPATAVVSASTTGGLIGSNQPDAVTEQRQRIAAENARVDAIRRQRDTYRDVRFPANAAPLNASTAGGTPVAIADRSIADVAIESGWTPEQAEIAMLREHRNFNVVTNTPAGNGPARIMVLQAAMSQSIGHTNLERMYTPQTLDAAHRAFRGRMGLQEMIIEAAVINGYHGSRNYKGNHRAILQAAFSTFDLGGSMSAVVNKSLLEGYEGVDSAWEKFVRKTRANDFKALTSYRGIGSFRFERVPADGHIPHGAMREESYTNQIDTYGKMFAITRKDQINDDLGILSDVPRMLGRGGAISLVRAIYTEFLANSAFFVAGNNNVSTGVLGVTGLNAALAVFRKQKDAEGEYIMATPKILLTPVELEASALALKNSTNVVSGLTTAGGVPESNPHAGKYEVVTSPYLSDSTFPGYSAVAYYLLADPREIPTIEVAFLDGVERPTVETAETDFSTLGIQMRGYFDWGVNLMDHRGGVRSTGA